MAGPGKLVARFEQHLALPGERHVATVLDNSTTIESGSSMGVEYHGDEAAQRLATSLGFDITARLPYYALTMTDRRLVGWTFSLGKDPTLTFEVPLPGPRLTFREVTSVGTTRIYAVVEFGDRTFTTMAIQTKTFGIRAGGTKAGWDALVAAFGTSVTRAAD